MKISKIRDVKTPTRGTPDSAGIDFYVPNVDFDYAIPVNGSLIIPSGIKANVPPGYALIAFNKSGVATKKGLSVGACVVDEDYQGEIHIHLFNNTRFPVIINPGEKIVQFILIPVFTDTIEEVPLKELYDSNTVRGEGWQGSTGIN